MAAGWASTMASRGSLSHSTLPNQIVAQGAGIAGENVGYGSSATVVFNALTNSASHLANMTNPAFTRLGVGAALDGNGRLWVVQVFAG